MTKIDEKGRILLPKEIREELNLKPSEEMFVMSVGKEMVLLKKVNVKKMVEDMTFGRSPFYQQIKVNNI